MEGVEPDQHWGWFRFLQDAKSMHEHRECGENGHHNQYHHNIRPYEKLRLCNPYLTHEVAIAVNYENPNLIENIISKPFQVGHFVPEFLVAITPIAVDHNRVDKRCSYMIERSS